MIPAILISALFFLFAIPALAATSSGAITIWGMVTVMGAWLTANSPILLAFLPSLIVGLSSSPRTQGAVPFLKGLLKLFSVVTHKDERGTFQLPFGLQAVISAPQKNTICVCAVTGGPDMEASTYEKYRAETAPSKLVTGLVLAIALQASCAGWTAEQKAAAGLAALDCTVGSLAKAATDVLPAVSTVIKGGSVNWEDQMESLGVGFGLNAVTCAAKQVIASLSTSSSAMRASPAFIEQSQATTARATKFFQKHNYDPQKITPPLPLPDPPSTPEPAPASPTG